MSLIRWSTDLAEVADRVGVRLRAGSSARSNQVVWESRGRRALLHLSTLRLVVKDGWLLVNLSVETEPTGARLLQFIFFLGQDGEGDGTDAGATVHVDSLEGAQLAELWGEQLERVIWDGVLDVIEGSLAFADVHQGSRGLPLSLLGYTCSGGRLHVDLQAGEGV
jgi:hypothetical protein